MKYYKAGSTAIIKSLSPKSGNTFSYSPSTTLNYTFPDCWVLSWVPKEDKTKLEIQKTYNFSSEFTSNINKLADDLFEKDILTWPNLFKTFDDLHQFVVESNFAEQDLVYCSLSFPETELQDIEDILKPTSKKTGEPGIYKILKNRELEKRAEINIYGYDIIGIEYGGIIYTSHNMDLFENTELNIKNKYNKFGLINTYEECKLIFDVAVKLDHELPLFICRIDKEEIHPTTAST